MPKATKHRINSIMEYNKENYARICIQAKPEEIEAIKSAAKAEGKSTTRYIIDRCVKNP